MNPTSLFTPASRQIFALGIGLTPPWEIQDVVFEEVKDSGCVGELQVHVYVGAARGALYRCPVCGKECKAHDFIEKTWRHMDFFQYKCLITARIPRVDCHDHGFPRADVPWARQGSGFTLLMEQVILAYARYLPVLSLAGLVRSSCGRIWRTIQYYVDLAMKKVDMRNVSSIALDETAGKRGHNYITIFADMNRESRPVLFATSGKGMETVVAFKNSLEEHGGDTLKITQATCDMSPSFISGIKKEFPNVNITVDIFHIVQTFTSAVDKVRRLEMAALKKSGDWIMPKGTRFAVLKNTETPKTDRQKEAFKELEKHGAQTIVAFSIKERLRYVLESKNLFQATRNFKTFLKWARDSIKSNRLLAPMLDAVETLERHLKYVLNRWESGLCTARMESLNSLFQAARYRAKGYRLDSTFIRMVYLIAAPIQHILWPTGTMAARGRA